MRGFRSFMVALSMALAPAALAADVGVPVQQPPPSSDWTVTIGLGALGNNLWEGSDRYSARPWVLFDVRTAGTPAHFHSLRDGIGYALYDTGTFRAGPVGKIRFPRDEDDDKGALRGLGDVDFAVELGGFVEYWPIQWLRLRGELRQGIGGHHGIVSDLTADIIKPINSQLTLSAGPRLVLASGAATNPYFGVDATQSTLSGLPMFDANGGLRSVGAGAQAKYQWSRQWATHLFLEYDRLQGDAARSPIVVQRGSPDQWTFGGGLTYEFDMRKWW